MRAYSVHIRNKEESWRTGAVDQTILTLAEDIMSALMYAEEKCSEITAKMVEAGIKNTENIRIDRINEEYVAVTGNIGINFSKDSQKSHDEWMEDMVAKVKKGQAE